MESELKNRSPRVGERDERDDNSFGLRKVDHFALPTKNLPLLERFVRELLGGEPYYYAGFDQTDRDLGRVPHIFIRVGDALLQCTEFADSDNLIRKDDPRLAPHIAFQVSAEGLRANTERLRKHIPVAGPYSHRAVDCVSIYFQSPEGHKFEICTWEPFPEEEATMIGTNGVRGTDWKALAHDWRGTASE